MATCPRCLGPLSDGHKCKPIWIKRLRRQVIATIIGGFFGSFVQLLVWTEHGPPVMGFVIGGLLFFGISEAMRD